MEQELNIWVLGGDLRQEKLAGFFREDGHRVHTYAMDAGALPGGEAPAKDLAQLRSADCVVLPLPVCAEGGMLSAPRSETVCPIETVLDALLPGQFICGGRVDAATRTLAEERGLTIHDYFQREELAVANAVPAALAV